MVADNSITDFIKIYEVKKTNLSYVCLVIDFSFRKRKALYRNMFGLNDGIVLIFYNPHEGKNVIFISLFLPDHFNDDRSEIKRYQ